MGAREEESRRRGVDRVLVDGVKPLVDSVR